MDYGGGSFLTQAQWKKIQNPGVIINWFDDAEDAQFSQVAACISSAALDMAMNYVFKWVEVNFLDQNPNNNYSLTDFKNIWASSDKWEVFSSAGIACGASLVPLPTDKAKLVGVAMASFGAGGVALIADAGNQYDKLPANLGFTAKIQRVNWEQSFKKAGIQAFIAGVATGVSLYAIDHPRFRNFAATLRGIGYAKVKQIMTQSGFSDDANDAFCRRFGLQIVSGAGNDLLALLNKQKQRLQNLKTQHGNLDFNDFAPTGGKTTNDITSTMYNEMFADLGSRTNWTTQSKVDKIVEVLGSGKTIPQKVTNQQGAELFKVVKKGGVPSPTTEYWVTKTELDDLISKGSNLESKSGLPLGSMADEYDIYKITANQPAHTYRSIIAPTTQRGYATTGGATQTLVLDRSLWSTPVKYNTQPFIPDF